MNTRGTLLLLIKAVASLVLLIFMGRKVSWSESWTHLSQMNWVFAILATLMLGLVHWLCAVRWHFVSGRVLGLSVCARYTWISQIYALILPGALSADLAKGVIMTASKHGAGSAVVPVSIMVDRLSGLAVLILFGEVACWFVEPLRDRAPAWILVSIACSLVGLIAFPGLLKAGVHGLQVSRLFSKSVFSMSKIVQESLVLPYRTWFVAVGMSVVIHACNITFYWFAMKAVFLQESWWMIAIYTCALNLAMLLPVSIGGIGLREHLSALMFAAGTASAGVAFSWLVLLISVAHGLVGLILQLIPANDGVRRQN
jgi:uncharacterized membrane protein YbhN (UPF0104 family)